MITTKYPAQNAGRPPETDRLFAAFEPLLTTAPTAPSVAAVANALGTELVVLRDLQADGKTYGGDNREAGWTVEYFINPTGRFNLDVKLGRSSDAAAPHAQIAHWQALLAELGWNKMPSISHPMRMETFVKDSWECRLEHDGIEVSRVALLNI